MKSPRKVAILLGSDSDVPRIQGAIDALGKLEIPFELRILSAHRTPDALREFLAKAPAEGFCIFLAGAGGAAHLAGTVAAHTRLPVIGIPIENPPFGGLDSLLSTVQMPGGVPVATFGVGPGGATNAALFAARILALDDEKVRAALERYHAEMSAKVLEKDKQVRKADTSRPPSG